MSYIREIREFVGHKRLISVACAGLIENENEELLLQFRADTQNYGTPGGNIELGESLLTALKREIYEEIGVKIDETQAKLFGIYSGEPQVTIYPNKDEVQYVVVVFYIKISSKTRFNVDLTESSHIKYFNRNSLPKNIKSSDSLWIEKWKNANFDVVVD